MIHWFNWHSWGCLGNKLTIYLGTSIRSERTASKRPNEEKKFPFVNNVLSSECVCKAINTLLLFLVLSEIQVLFVIKGLHAHTHRAGRAVINKQQQHNSIREQKVFHPKLQFPRWRFQAPFPNAQEVSLFGQGKKIAWFCQGFKGQIFWWEPFYPTNSHTRQLQFQPKGKAVLGSNFPSPFVAIAIMIMEQSLNLNYKIN